MYLYPVLYAWIVHNLYRNDSSDRNAVIREIAGRYFNTNFVSVFLSATNPRESSYKTSLLKVLSENRTLQFYDRKVKADFLKTIRPTAIILLFEGDHDEQSVFRRLKDFRNNYSWNSRGKTFIIADGPPIVYMRSIWRVCRSADVAFWSFPNNEFYTWVPYKKNECDITKTIHRVAANELFKPLNLMNLNGCPLIASTSFTPPFVLQMNKETKMYDRGVECKLMEIIAEKMNGNLTYIEVPSKEIPWVLQTGDGKVVGVMGILNRQEADIAYAGMAINIERFQLAEPITSHAQDEIMWLTPTPNKGNPVRGLLKIFSVQIWVMAYAMLFAIASLMYYQEGRVSFAKCLLYAFIASMNLPIPMRKERFLLMLLYLAAVHIITVYQAMLLFHLVLEVKGNPIETFQEAVEANMFISLLPSFKFLMNATDPQLWQKVIQTKRYGFSYNLPSDVRNLIANRSSISLYPRYTSVFLINRMFPDGNQGPKVMMMKERVAVSSLAFFTPRGHPLKPFLDYRMNQILCGGFGEMWLKRYLKHDWSVETEVATEVSRRPLTVSNLRSILSVYVVLSAISIAVFIAEIFYKSYRSRKTRQR